MSIVTNEGVGLGVLETVRDRLGIGLQELADICGVDQSTLYRWRQGETTPHGLVRTRLTQLAEFMALLPRVFNGPDQARDWIRTSHPASLGGSKTPIEVMRGGRIDRVISVLQFLLSGA